MKSDKRDIITKLAEELQFAEDSVSRDAVESVNETLEKIKKLVDGIVQTTSQIYRVTDQGEASKSNEILYNHYKLFSLELQKMLEFTSKDPFPVSETEVNWLDRAMENAYMLKYKGTFRLSEWFVEQMEGFVLENYLSAIRRNLSDLQMLSGWFRGFLDRAQRLPKK